MFSGNTRGTMEVNNLKLHEIQQDILSRRLAKQITNDGILENHNNSPDKTSIQKFKILIFATAQLLVK